MWARSSRRRSPWIPPCAGAAALRRAHGESADTRKSAALDRTACFFASLGDAYRPAELFGVGRAEGLAAELKESPSLILMQDELKAFVDKAKRAGSIALPMVSTLFKRGG